MNAGLVLFPAFLCLLIILIETMVNSQLDTPEHWCGCKCVQQNVTGACQNVCGIEYSTATQAVACAVSRPQGWPALFQVPDPHFRAARTHSQSFEGLPDSSCLTTLSCPVTSLFTGLNQSVAENLVSRINLDAVQSNEAAPLDIGIDLNHSHLYYLGSESTTDKTFFVEPSILSKSPMYLLRPHCLTSFNFKSTIAFGSSNIQKDIDCVKSVYAWRANSSVINTELRNGFWSVNSALEIHEYLAAYDFMTTNNSKFDICIWYNSTYWNLITDPRLIRVFRSINMISNSFLRQFKNEKIRIPLNFVKEMPRSGRKITLELATIGPLLYAWVIQMLFPVMLASLVYEKQHKLRYMMKLHGLGDGPYRMISYCYFLLISCVYMFWFVLLGSFIGLEVFKRNSYVIQLMFYLIYLNLQIAFAFFAAIGFSDAKTATAMGYIYVFGSGLMGNFFFKPYIEDLSFSRRRLLIMELLPGFSLYNGLYELSQHALDGRYRETFGMRWSNLYDKENGMQGTLNVMALEWLLLLFLAYSVEQYVSSHTTSASQYLEYFWKTRKQSQIRFSRKDSSLLHMSMKNREVALEKYRVKEMLKEPNKFHPFVCYNLRKEYDGSSKKLAVKALSLAVPQRECFGLLGPNGSGKTTIINMVTGFLPPTSGTAFIGDLDIRFNMGHIYTKVSICPQQDLLWNELTGKEHLLFYGRLRNLKGERLDLEVDSLLNMVNLSEKKVCNQLVGTYSGGMKRRLSVAISLIGEANVVFMDEPTTGLDPESRSNLWQVIKNAKEKRAIILTTHSMDEAEFLCDRIGIIVKGALRCLGSAKEIKRRYSASYVLTISTNQIHGKKVEEAIRTLSPTAEKIYNVGGTQKFRLSKKALRLSNIFQAIAHLKRKIPVDAFDVMESSLEDAYINAVQRASRHEDDASPKTNL